MPDSSGRRHALTVRVVGRGLDADAAKFILLAFGNVGGSAIAIGGDVTSGRAVVQGNLRPRYGGSDGYAAVADVLARVELCLRDVVFETIEIEIREGVVLDDPDYFLDETEPSLTSIFVRGQGHVVVGPQPT